MQNFSKSDNKQYVLIMAGGSGTRLWPLSTQAIPKQFLKINNNNTLLENTLERAKAMCPIENIVIATNENFKKKIQKEIPYLQKENFLIEPIGRNTAPILALFCSILRKKCPPDTVVLVLSADHYIEPIENFVETVQRAKVFLEDTIFCFGIPPTRPETEYGYIKRFKKKYDKSIYKVKKFTEKPNKKLAKKYFQNKKFFWNAGIFLFNIQMFLDETQKYAPLIYNIAQEIASNPNSIQQKFPIMPNISVDYAILEKSTKIFVIKSKFLWDDIGSFTALQRILEKKENDHYPIHSSQYIELQSHNNIIYSKNHYIALLGMKNTIVIENNGVIFIANLNDIKKTKLLREKAEKKFL